MLLSLLTKVPSLSMHSESCGIAECGLPSFFFVSVSLAGSSKGLVAEFVTVIVLVACLAIVVVDVIIFTAFEELCI